MPCEQLKDIVLYGGLVISALSFIASILINRNFRKILKEHNIEQQKLKAPNENLPLPVQGSVKSVKIAFVASVVIILIWILCLVAVLKAKC